MTWSLGEGLGEGTTSGLGDGDGCSGAGDGLGAATATAAAGHTAVGSGCRLAAGRLPGGIPQLPNRSLLYLTWPDLHTRVQLPGPRALNHCTNSLLGPQGVPMYTTLRTLREPQRTAVVSVVLTLNFGTDSPLLIVAVMQLPELLVVLLGLLVSVAVTAAGAGWMHVGRAGAYTGGVPHPPNLSLFQAAVAVALGVMIQSSPATRATRLVPLKTAYTAV